MEPLTRDFGVCIVALNRAIPGLLGLAGDSAPGGSAVGGIEVQVVTLARLLAQRGWHVKMLVADSGQAARCEVAGITIIRAQCRWGGAIGKLVRLSQLLRALRRTGPDVVVQQGASAVAGLVTLAVRALGRKCVFWLASDTDACCTDAKASRLAPSQRRIAAYALRAADLVVAQTRHQQELVRENFRRDSAVIHNPWPVGTLQPRRAEPPFVLWVANLRWEKRPEMVLELAAAAPAVRFVMVGGPMPGNEQLYDRVCREASDYPNLEFVGYVPFAQVGSYFERASVFLNTSLVEGFPNSFLQAWDAELPVVASFDPDGVLVREGLGFHCQTAGDFTANLTLLLNQPELREAVGKRAKAYLAAQFGADGVVEEVERALQAVTRAARGGPSGQAGA